MNNILKIFSVISVEKALCLKTVRLITTSDHIGLKTAPHRTYKLTADVSPKTRNRICVTDVRNDSIKCVTYTQPCSVGYKMHNCVTAGN